MKKNNLFSILVKGFGIFCLLALIGICAFSFLRQNRLLDEKETELRQQKQELEDLTSERDLLVASLSEKEAYIDEFDTTLFAKKEEEDFPQPETDTTEDTGKESADSSAKDETPASSGSYKKKYKSLYAPKEEHSDTSDKIVCLTFDDGPSQNTPKVLDILDKYNIKATFFVVKTDNEEFIPYYKEIVERGHTIAIHTASHNYKKIYASVDAYLEDFNEIYTLVEKETGVKPALFRYPGGSTNCQSYASGSAIMEEMERRGFIYYDWNVSSGDGGNQATRDTIYDWVTGNAAKRDYSVVLMHDSGGKAETVAALPSIIETLQKQGCKFQSLDQTSTPVQFGK